MARKGQDASARAHRFPVQLPVRYRIPRSPEWFEARTENVSHTGILVRAGRIFKPTTIVEVRLEVPTTTSKGPHAEFVCKCEVVRVEQDDGLGVSPALALAIQNYRLTREPNANFSHFDPVAAR